MRILRGKSNLEVSSHGVALFVVGLVLATFLGGAVRTILKSDRVHARIISELKNRFPRNEFQIGSVEVLLSRGLWPGLALRVNNAAFKQDVCGKLSFQLDMPQAVLPVDLLSLRHGRVRLGTVDVLNGKMHLDYRECPPRTAETASPALPSPGIRSAVAAKGIKPPTLDWAELGKALEGLELENFEITYERNHTWKLVLKTADLHLGEELQLQAVVDVQKSLPFGTLSHVVELDAHGVDHNLEWTVASVFKEGQLKWTGNWDLAANTALTKVLMVQFPLKDLTSELHQMGFIDRDIKLKTAWLTCQAQWEGEVAKLTAMPVRVRACKVEGAYGRVDLDQADIFLNDEQPLKVPAQLQVQKLQIQPLIESLGRQVLPAVLARLGVWSGAVHYSAPNNWQMDGFLENAEVVFSNQSVRGKQIIRSAHTQAAGSSAGVEARISKVQILDGEFEGEVVLKLSEDLRSGAFDVQVERIGFSPAIQQILIGGQMAPLKVSGKGGLSGGELSAWNGQFSSASMQGDGWQASAVEVKSRFVPNVFHIEAHAAQLTAHPSWRHFSQLRVVREEASGPINWKDLVAKIEVQRNGGSITALSAYEAGRGTPWRVKANWVRDGNLTGTLLVGGNRQVAYALRGEKGALYIHDKMAGDPQ